MVDETVLVVAPTVNGSDAAVSSSLDWLLRAQVRAEVGVVLATCPAVDLLWEMPLAFDRMVRA